MEYCSVALAAIPRVAVWALLLVFSLGHASADLRHVARLEINAKQDTRRHRVFPVGRQGVIFYAESDSKDAAGGLTIHLTKYDLHLVEQWTRQVHLPWKTVLEGSAFDGEVLHLFLCRDTCRVVSVDPSGENVSVAEIDGTYGSVGAFLVQSGMALFADYRKKRTDLVVAGLEDGSVARLPLRRKASLRNVLWESDDDLVSATAQYKIKRKTWAMEVVQFRGTDLERTLNIRPEGGQNLLRGRLLSLENGSHLLIGTYGRPKKTSAQGMFLCKMTSGSLDYLRFHSFSEFEHFFSHLSRKRQAKLEKKLDKKKSQGVDLKHSYALLIHNPIEYGGHHLLVAEAYYAVYSTQTHSYTTWTTDAQGHSRSTTHTTTVSIFQGYNHSHAILAAFDREGNLSWANSFEMGDILAPRLKQQVTVVSQGDRLLLFYPDGRKIRSKVIRENDVLQGKNYMALPTGHERDKVKRTWKSDFEHLYDDHYLAWGYQKVKNPDLGGRRKVFYLSTLVFDTHSREDLAE